MLDNDYDFAITLLNTASDALYAQLFTLKNIDRSLMADFGAAFDGLRHGVDTISVLKQRVIQHHAAHIIGDANTTISRLLQK